jgi:4'-phosphopantetheinyl transferase
MNRPAIPAAGEVQIWFTCLDRHSAELARLERLLSPDERARADRLLDRLTRDRFVAGRGFLRATLAEYLSVQPADLRFAAGEHGKPMLDEEAGSAPLYFNLSHADDSAILAVASDREVGIDLERVRDDLPFREMAQPFYSTRERAELFSLPEEQQLAAFFHCWTRKEAYLKGCGSGFSQPSDSFDVSLLPGHPPALLEHRAASGAASRWRIVDIPVPAGYYAALAVEGEVPVVRCMT